MRIVLVSSGQVARQFAVELSREHDVTVVHAGEEGRAELEKLDVELLEGEGNDAVVLRRAGAPEADHLIACSHSDEMNILACLTARQLGTAQTICFVGKEEYVRTFGAEDGGVVSGAPTLGIDRLVWPARMLADKIEKILAVPGATDVGQFARGRISLLEYRLREGIPLVNRPLADIRNLPPGVLIVAVTRGDDWFVPRGQSVLHAGDRVLFMGRSEAMHPLAVWFTEHLGEGSSGEVVIIGGGTVGLRLARSMEVNPKARLKLIEHDSERCAEIAQVLERTLVLNGDGCDLDLLETEHVRYARALVAVTDSDEKNLLASLLGRQLGIPKVVTRVTSAANRRVFERVGIDVPLSARGAATEAVMHMIRHRDADLLATLGEGHGEVLEITLPERFTPTALKELSLPPDSIVAALVRREEAIVPGGATLVGPGDRCLVICKVERVEEVLKILLR
ncbi:MAG: Trk system potassium transporter TrkA [Planctomycetota bacterium]|jgi:trk system potassium uptake protein TrkA